MWIFSHDRCRRCIGQFLKCDGLNSNSLKCNAVIRRVNRTAPLILTLKAQNTEKETHKYTIFKLWKTINEIHICCQNALFNAVTVKCSFFGRDKFIPEFIKIKIILNLYSRCGFQKPAGRLVSVFSHKTKFLRKRGKSVTIIAAWNVKIVGFNDTNISNICCKSGWCFWRWLVWSIHSVILK